MIIGFFFTDSFYHVALGKRDGVQEFREAMTGDQKPLADVNPTWKLALLYP